VVLHGSALTDGAPLYETMQRLKTIPLAQKLYRQIAMPLLDKLIRKNKGFSSTPARVGDMESRDSGPEEKAATSANNQKIWEGNGPH